MIAGAGMRLVLLDMGLGLFTQGSKRDSNRCFGGRQNTVCPMPVFTANWTFGCSQSKLKELITYPNSDITILQQCLIPAQCSMERSLLHQSQNYIQLWNLP